MAVVIAPCEVLSIKYCEQPSRAIALKNISPVILFFITLYFVKDVKFTMRIFVGIIFTIIGIYLIT